MTITKYNHEYELKDNAYRKLDPIGKMSFNQQVVATKEGNVHTIDLEKSSNFLVKIEDVDSWIQFVNYSDIHRFDVLIEITGNITVNSIKFGNGDKEYHYPQLNLDYIDHQEIGITPYITWPYGIKMSEGGASIGDKIVLTVRYGPTVIDRFLQDTFVVVQYRWFGS